VLSLYRKDLPSSKLELAQALDESLHRFLQQNGQIVDIHARVFPYLDEIAINLDGARVDSPPPASPRLVGGTTLAYEAALVTLTGRQISVRGVPLSLRMEAHNVVFHKGQDENGHAVLIVQKARDGNLVLSAVQRELEAAIAEISQREGRGITIDQVQLRMRARGARSLAADLSLKGRKLFLQAKIDISGQLDIDDDFTARISNLKCKADGAVGSLARSVLDPVFRQLEGKSFPLASLPLGNIQLRDIRIAVADTIELTTNFGSNAE
jgi:hypothetical protein